MKSLRTYIKMILKEASRKKSGLQSRLGQCYALSGRYVTSNPGSILIHGSIQGFGNPRIGHAWVELPDGKIFDTVWDKELDKQVHDGLFHPIVDNKYDHEQVIIMTLETGNWGPWD